MSHDPLRRDLYLRTLARLRRSLDHELRSHAGSVSLQLDLMSELVARGVADGAKLEAPIQRAKTGLERLRKTAAAVVEATDVERGRNGADLGAVLRGIEGLLAPRARELGVTWAAVAPLEPVPLAGDGDAVREALTIAAVESLEALPNGARLTLAAAVDGGRAAVALEGAIADSSSPTLALVRAAIASAGGEAVAGDDGAPRFTLPLAT